MKIVSWNVAGYRACLKKGFIDFFEKENADIVCLQEVKATFDQIDYSPEGYYCYLNPAERKGYSGVLVYTKEKPLNVIYGINIEKHDHEGRVITCEYSDFFIVTVYTPNAKRNLERLCYRVDWEEDFKNYLTSLDKPVIVMGDFNVAHTEIDLANPKQNERNAGYTIEERNCFSKLLSSGFIDVYRYLYPDKKHIYTWWSYLGRARERNIGWRIDYFLLSNSIINKVEDMVIYDEIYGSDHCPIRLSIDL